MTVKNYKFQKNEIFKNDNGRDYLILDKKESTLLLAEINGIDFVIAKYPEKTSWGSGMYYWNIHDAYLDWESI